MGRISLWAGALAVFCSMLIFAAPLKANLLDQQERLLSLRSNSITERVEALIWLAEHGENSGSKVVVKSLRDESLEVRKLAEQTLWSIWSRSGSSRVDDMLRTGGFLMSQGSFHQAVRFFDEVISEMPAFAEGYNKRATAWYLLGSYSKSLADINQTLARNPFHFGALSGAGYCLIQLERYGEAIGYLRRALEINPNMDGVRELSKTLMKRLRRQTI